MARVGTVNVVIGIKQKTWRIYRIFTHACYEYDDRGSIYWRKVFLNDGGPLI